MRNANRQYGFSLEIICRAKYAFGFFYILSTECGT